MAARLVLPWAQEAAPWKKLLLLALSIEVMPWYLSASFGHGTSFLTLDCPSSAEHFDKPHGWIGRFPGTQMFYCKKQVFKKEYKGRFLRYNSPLYNSKTTSIICSSRWIAKQFLKEYKDQPNCIRKETSKGGRFSPAWHLSTTLCQMPNIANRDTYVVASTKCSSLISP